jgi:hypothetical protein
LPDHSARRPNLVLPQGLVLHDGTIGGWAMGSLR